MKNKTIYLDALRWMVFPILTKVIYEAIKILVVFVMAYYLGKVTDVALAGNYDLFLETGKDLLYCMIISVICVPMIGIIMDFIWIKAGTNSDIEMCSQLSLWKYNKLRMFDEGEIEYKLSQELCEFRIYFANIVSSILLIPFFFLFIMYSEKQLGVGYILIGLSCSAITLFIPLVCRKINYKYEQETWQYNTKRKQILIQLSEHSKIFKLYKVYDHVLTKWHQMFEDFFKQSRKSAIKIKNTGEQINEFIKVGTKIAILVLGAVLVEQKSITTGGIVVMLSYLSVYNDFWGRCIQLANDFLRFKGKGERLGVFYDNLEPQIGTSITKEFESIRCKNLSYRYNEECVLEKIQFEIRKGEKVQILGKNGCGKSTLIRILCGLQEDYKGEITVDGVNLKGINLKQWRDKISVIFQDAYIFPGSVLENVMMGNMSADEESVQEVAKLMGISDMLMKKITYGATELSGGEKQRIAVARALLKESEILILDEGENHLDMETRKRLCNYINESKKTIVFISHNQESAFVADRIICL